MQKLSYQAALGVAQSAAIAGNWSQLNQSLQALLSSEDASGFFSDSATATTLLELALQVLEFGSFHDRWEVSKLLPNFGIDAIAPLMELLDDEEIDPEAHWFAIRILGDFNHPLVISALIEVLQTSQSEELNASAIAALANMGKTAIPAIATLLDQPSTRLLAAQTLGQIRHSEIVPLLLQIVSDADPQVRAIALEALSSFHSPAITLVLVQALQDLSVPVRLAAVTGLGFCHPDDAKGVNLVSYLRPLLLDLNLEVCRQAAIALGRLGTSSAIAALAEVLSSPYTPVPLEVDIIRALGWSNTLEGVTALQKTFLEMTLSETAQLEILNALGRVEAPELKSMASEILLQILQTDAKKSDAVKQAIALSLGQLGNVSAMQPLIHLLADPDVGVRLHVISALKMLEPTSAYQLLEQISQLENEESELGKGVAIALKEWNLTQ